jgi:hypothetical protein
MTTFTVHFRTDAECASSEIKAKTAKRALASARKIAVNKPETLFFEPYQGVFDINEIEVFAEDGSAEAIWYDEDLHVRLAASDLLSAARLVIARWESGDLAEAVRELSAAVAKAEGGAT